LYCWIGDCANNRKNFSTIQMEDDMTVQNVQNQPRNRIPWWAWVLIVIGGIAVLGWLCRGTLWIGNTVLDDAIVRRMPVAVVQPTSAPSDDTQSPDAGSAAICKYADSYTAEGKVVPAGTLVQGPAFVKPDRNRDWGRPIYVGEEYTTRASDEVIWLLTGDNACVDSQHLFFSIWGKDQ
jgi:hypothetical protein